MRLPRPGDTVRVTTLSDATERYTLDEARQILAAEKCVHASSFEVTMVAGEPTRVVCSSCGRAWPVGPVG